MQPERTNARRAPGLLVAMLIAGVATLAARRLHWPDMLVALGLGLLLAQTLRGARWSAGLTFASQTVLRTGIALLGFRVTLAQLMTLGWTTVLTVIVAILCVFAAAWALARLSFLNIRPCWFCWLFPKSRLAFRRCSNGLGF